MKELITYIKKKETTPESILKEIKDFVKSSNKDNFEVVISEVKDIRSAAQNKFFHGVILKEFCNASIGTNLEHRTVAAWKQVLKKMFLKAQIGEVDFVMDTHELTVDLFSTFITSCISYLTSEKINGVIMEQDRKIYEHSTGIK